MPGIVTKHPAELCLRAVLALSLAIWIFYRFGSPVLNIVIPFYQTLIQSMDSRYRIDLMLTHMTGHDKVGSDLVLLGNATATQIIGIFANNAYIPLQPGSQLKSSTTVGLLMQPAVVILAVTLGWPSNSIRQLIVRLMAGSVAIALWLYLGIPLSLWINFQDIPIQALAGEENFYTVVRKFFLNNGGVVVGAWMAAGAISFSQWLATRYPSRSRTDVRPSSAP